MHFDHRRIVTAAGQPFVHVYDRLESRQWICGEGVSTAGDNPLEGPEVDTVRMKDGYMVEGRENGWLGVWSV